VRPRDDRGRPHRRTGGQCRRREFQPFGVITKASSDGTFGRNVTGALFTLRKALPLLVDGASIVLTGSTTSITGTPNMIVDAATRATIRNLARIWTLELKDRRIRALVRITKEAAS
jgi:NAD(P)-dependent dehydrogenase (short-subunit alcohol dehydrogenase family)